MAEQPDFREALARAMQRVLGGTGEIGPLTRLSGGASQETWAFSAAGRDFILRRAPGGTSAISPSGNAIGLPTEAAVITAARAAGVAAPEVIYVLTPEDGAGTGYVMARVEGETLARRILRDAQFDAVRGRLAHQCGEAMARIHATTTDAVPQLPRIGGQTQLRQYHERYQAYDQPKPVFELAFKWLQNRLKDDAQLVLVHGDFRNGNIMVHPKDGLNAVLDWELAHIGDPLEDLGWICVNSWRFGVSGRAAGGFGSVEDLLEGYRAGGGPAFTAEDVKVWEVFGTLKWGIMCMSMYEAFRTGFDRSVERAAIGRRSSETEIDLVNLLIG
ncbi:MAG: phosphotransferase family protein [Micropepsaceae bacterium]